MSELIRKGSEEDIPYIEPLIEDVGKAFVEWAEQYWGMKTAYDKPPPDPNSESCGWEVVKPYFINKINELVKNKKPEDYPPGYYKLEIIEKPITEKSK